MKPCSTLLKARRNHQWKKGRKQCVQLLCDTGEPAEGYQWKRRRLLKSSEVNKVGVEEFERTKGSVAGKLACSLRDNFLRVSRAKIQTILNMDKSHYRRNAKCLNRAKLKPIRAIDVYVRHPIDLMDVSKKWSVKTNGHFYRYVLTVIDTFSRFLWLRPLESKSSQVITSESESIYMEHGSPDTIQCDRGGEFKKALKLLRDRMNIKLIYGCPRHLQSQGKVERCISIWIYFMQTHTNLAREESTKKCTSEPGTCQTYRSVYVLSHVIRFMKC